MTSGDRVDVHLLYFDGCPNWREADDRVREALRRVGADPGSLRHTVVATPEDAERLSFRGSPTFLVGGVDPFADPSASVGLACRVYATPDGLRGAPTVEQLLAVMPAEGPTTIGGTGVSCPVGTGVVAPQ